MNSRESAIAKLQQLSEPSLEKVNQLLDNVSCSFSGGMVNAKAVIANIG